MLEFTRAHGQFKKVKNMWLRISAEWGAIEKGRPDAIERYKKNIERMFKAFKKLKIILKNKKGTETSTTQEVAEMVKWEKYSDQAMKSLVEQNKKRKLNLVSQDEKNLIKNIKPIFYK